MPSSRAIPAPWVRCGAQACAASPRIPTRPENHGSGSSTSEIGLKTMSSVGFSASRTSPGNAPNGAIRDRKMLTKSSRRWVTPGGSGVTTNMYIAVALSGMYPALTPSAW